MYEQDYNMYLRGHGLAPHVPAPSAPLVIHPYLGAGGAAAIPSTSYSHQYDRPYQLALHGLMPGGSGLSQPYPTNLHIHKLFAAGGAVPIPGGIIAGKPDPRIKLELLNEDLWSQFNKIGTEMIIAKNGRCMFPAIKVKVSGLDPNVKYILIMDMIPENGYRYRYNGREWVVASNADPHVMGRYFVHPDSPASGTHWMRHEVTFQKMKLTNNLRDQNGHITLNTMHKYRPRIHIITSNDLSSIPSASCNTYMFPQTTFIAVTAYQNTHITQLKIDNNPFAKGFRESGQSRSKNKSDKTSVASDRGCEVTSSSNQMSMAMSMNRRQHHQEKNPDDVVMSDQGYSSSSMSPEEKPNDVLQEAAFQEEEEEIEVGRPTPPLPYLLPPPVYALDEEREATMSRSKDKDRAEVKREEREINRPPPATNEFADAYRLPLPVRDTPRFESREATAAGQLHLNPGVSPSGMMAANAMNYPYLYYNHMLSAAAMRDSYPYRHFVPNPSISHQSSLSASSLHNPYKYSLSPPPGFRHY